MVIKDYGGGNFMKAQPINSKLMKDFNCGEYYKSYEMLGAHFMEYRGKKGVRFGVWAPHAQRVCVAGDFNNWDGSLNIMKLHGDSGIWFLFIPELEQNILYKYEITTLDGKKKLKSDPYAFYSELRPGTASKIYSLDNYKWHDEEWMKKKSTSVPYNSPMLIYEVHAGSWKQKENGEYYNFRELADILIDYVIDMGYTHIEFLPIAEYPFDGSWGYQVTGYYSITSRYGCPEDFMYFVDTCHKKGIGVIVDWVCAHFCRDECGLRKFDGLPLYENENPLISDNPEWGTCNFDFSKSEVSSFLISNAYFYFDVYHVDGLRADAVASMLYLDYAKEKGRWTQNKYGGRENLEAVDFFRKLNETIFKYFPGSLMIAEESTAWPMVTAPAYVGGLGFNYKWNMGWMNDLLDYMQQDSINRKWFHNKITFSFTYTYSENYILPLSHDEVVHGKKSLIEKMNGDYWQKFANLRVFYAYMMAHPGKKLLFMGGEFGQFIEWREYSGLDWILLDYDMHKKLKYYVKELNNFYRLNPALWQCDHKPCGFDFIDGNDYNNSIITFMRKGEEEYDFIIIVCNFTPVVRYDYRIGVPYYGIYTEVFNTDREEYGGAQNINSDKLCAESLKWHNKPYSLKIMIPPLAAIYLKLSRKAECPKSIHKPQSVHEENEII